MPCIFALIAAAVWRTSDRSPTCAALDRSPRCPYFASYAKTNQMEFPHTFSWHAVHLLCRMLALSSSSRLGFAEVRSIACKWQQDLEERRAVGTAAAASLAAAAGGVAANPQAPAEAPAEAAIEAATEEATEEAEEAEAAAMEAAEAVYDRSGYGRSVRRSKRQRLPARQEAAALTITEPYGAGVAIPVLNSPRSEWPRRRDLCPQPPSWRPHSAGRTALRHLGWEGLPQPATTLFDALQAAIRRIGLGCTANSDNWSLLTHPGANCAKLPGAASIVVEAWVAVGSAQRQAICIKRVSGDTFVFHSFCASDHLPCHHARTRGAGAAHSHAQGIGLAACASQHAPRSTRLTRHHLRYLSSSPSALSPAQTGCSARRWRRTTDGRMVPTAARWSLAS